MNYKYAIGPAHSYHLLVELHGRWEGLGVSAQDVAKVDVDEVSRLGEKEVIQVSVAHAKRYVMTQ